MPREMAIRGTHDAFMKVLSGAGALAPGARVLDIGAGEGALSARLQAAGLSVAACDLVPDHFHVPGVECRRCEPSGALPFPDGQFDLAVAVEVLEHIDGHDRFFAEAARVLKPGGALVFTTPNILSLKSRIRFLFTGSFYSFKPLTPFTRDPVHQHISPFTVNRYEWMLSQHGFRVCRVTTDKLQTTSLLLSFLAPVIALSARLTAGRGGPADILNARACLFGRKLAVVARKADTAGGGRA